MDVQSMFSLKGKTALVTGAASGIGQAIAAGLAGAGADVVIVGNKKSLEETQTLIEISGQKAFPYKIDLNDSGKISAGIEEILSSHQIDILVNNAGIVRSDDAVDLSMTAWQESINVNLNAVFQVTQLVAKPMLERKSGKIISTASLLSFQGGMYITAYSASKHAVTGMTKSLSNEWAKHNVQVNCIAPGYIETNMTKPIRDNEKREREIFERIPAGRWGKPDDMVGAAIFLSSSASDYVSGHTLVVDGGWLGR
ncbi:SDR family oxidoreductase [Falsibacillus pallidus]|uniref:2-deoxy-D-gluconate 3-dehydrogenase n=1 Tax=Falsibacillus pallidus TaxID=493781 RepID=A0A370G201_9BACI|nr:SDR family oxidoreductase [Falsibacillus pallidus]RDI36889.1 2-deoxy-D-gluconate 3-dehydrogenase [Falsibacillus pallidus]